MDENKEKSESIQDIEDIKLEGNIEDNDDIYKDDEDEEEAKKKKKRIVSIITGIILIILALLLLRGCSNDQVVELPDIDDNPTFIETPEPDVPDINIDIINGNKGQTGRYSITIQEGSNKGPDGNTMGQGDSVGN